VMMCLKSVKLHEFETENPVIAKLIIKEGRSMFVATVFFW